MQQMARARRAVRDARSQAQRHVATVYQRTERRASHLQEAATRQIMAGADRRLLSVYIARWRRLPAYNRRMAALFQRGILSWRWKVVWGAFGTWAALVRVTLRDEEATLQRDLDELAEQVRAATGEGSQPPSPSSSPSPSPSQLRIMHNKNAAVAAATREQDARKATASEQCAGVTRQIAQVEQSIADESASMAAASSATRELFASATDGVFEEEFRGRTTNQLRELLVHSLDEKAAELSAGRRELAQMEGILSEERAEVVVLITTEDSAGSEAREQVTELEMKLQALEAEQAVGGGRGGGGGEGKIHRVDP